MRIAVDNLPAKGRTIRFSLADDWAQAASRRALEGGDVKVLEGSLKIVPGDEPVVEARGDVKARWACDRCGEPVETLWTLDESWRLRPEGSETGTGEIELSEDELDISYYPPGGALAEDLLVEALALQVPARILCSDPPCDPAALAEAARSASDAGTHKPFADLDQLLRR